MTKEDLHAAIQYFESVGAWQLAAAYRAILRTL